MQVNEHAQGTYEWKEARHGLIGGTGLSDLMGAKKVRDLALFDRLVSERCEDFFDEESYINEAMQRGLDLEPEAREAAEQYLDIKFKEFGWCTNPDNPINGCSPDGFTEDLTQGLEIKCPGSAKHVSYIRGGGIPKEYFWQIINYFLVNNKLETMHFVSYRPENNKKPLFVHSVKKDTELTLKTGRNELTQTVADWVIMAEVKSLAILNEVEKEIEGYEF